MPIALTARLFDVLTVPRTMALMSVRDTAFAPVLLTLTAPTKLLVAAFKVTAPLPPAAVVVPPANTTLAPD